MLDTSTVFIHLFLGSLLSFHFRHPLLHTCIFIEHRT